MTLALNGARASSVKILTPWSGPWVADVEVPIAPGLPAPTGAAVTTIGDATSLVGTIDPKSSGASAGRARLRVVAGAGGWEKTVAPQSYTNDAGVLSTVVLTTTAAEVGERVLEAVPSRIGTYYERAAGPASSVLAGLSWYVDARGITVVGPRPLTPATADVRILDYDPRTGVAELATTTDLVTPGTILTDERFGSLKIRDVEQTWSASGARARAWCIQTTATPAADGMPGAKMVAALAAIARQAVGVAHLKTYRYRVVKQGPDGRLTLQAVRKKGAMPDQKLVKIAPGVAGFTMKLAPGSIVLLSFSEGDPTNPIVRGFEGGPTPLEVALAAVLVTINDGAQGVARVGDTVQAGPFGGVITSGSLTVRCG